MEASYGREMPDHWKKERAKRNARLRRDWPQGKKKCQVVLEFIARHPEGLLESEIRQFVFTKNGGKGKSPAYYWMTVLRYPDPFSMEGKLSLLEGWCVRDPVTKRWRLRPGEVIKPPFFRDNMRGRVYAGHYRRVVGHDPVLDDIHLHGTFSSQCPSSQPEWEGMSWETRQSYRNECVCPIPDNAIIPGDKVPTRFRAALGLSTDE